MQIVNVRKSRIALAVFVLFIGVAIAAGIFIVRKARSSRVISISSLIQEAAQSSGSPSNPSPQPDSDNDGLPDWQEQVYGTDPSNPDTDGDGTPDGEEIKRGRDPLRPGPDDTQNTAQILTSANSDNLTEALARDLSGVLNSDLVQGKITSPEDLSSKINIFDKSTFQSSLGNILKTNEAEFTLPKLSDSGLNISKQNDDRAKRSYITSINLLLNTNRYPVPLNKDRSEVDVFTEAMTKQDFSDVEAIRIYYAQLALLVRNVPVPPDLLPAHKGLVGIFELSSRIAQAVENVNTDAVRTLLALNTYEELPARAFSALKGIAELSEKFELTETQ